MYIYICQRDPTYIIMRRIKHTYTHEKETCIYGKRPTLY